VGTLVAGVVNLSVAWWMLDGIHDISTDDTMAVLGLAPKTECTRRICYMRFACTEAAIWPRCIVLKPCMVILD